MTPYLIGIIVLSVFLHFLSIRFLISQFRVIGELSEGLDALEKELEQKR